jgi:hypothetical protein
MKQNNYSNEKDNGLDYITVFEGACVLAQINGFPAPIVDYSPKDCYHPRDAQTA